MVYLPEADLPERFGPYAAFRTEPGLMPGLFRAQTLLPRAIEAESAIADAVLLTEGALTRVQKERIPIAIAASHQDDYCVAAHWESLRRLGLPDETIGSIVVDHHAAGLPGAEVALIDYALKLDARPTWIGRPDVDALRRHGFSDEQILETVLVTGLAEFFCSLSAGLGVRPDRGPSPALRSDVALARPLRPTIVTAGAAHGDAPPLRTDDTLGDAFPPFASFRRSFGFIPNVFRAQTLRPAVVEAEARAIEAILLTEDFLSRTQKESIVVVVSARNLNTCCVAVHCEMLRVLGASEETADRIAVDHRRAGLPAADVALLDAALRLHTSPLEFGRSDIETLRRHGFRDAQILEAIVMTSLTEFLNTVQSGVGSAPDFHPRRIFDPEPRPPAGPAETDDGAAWTGRGPAPDEPAGEDPDADLLERVRAGENSAFEALVLRHAGRLYRTLVGLTGRAEDAEDALQSAFLKAFEHLKSFRGRSRFSTWLSRIAVNEALQRLRSRRALESLDDTRTTGEGEELQVREIASWIDDPERLVSRREIHALVERELTRLPAIYRTAVVLRDMEELSTEEASAALGINAATLKTRLSRGRLLLREALAPHFSMPGHRGRDHGPQGTIGARHD